MIVVNTVNSHVEFAKSHDLIRFLQIFYDDDRLVSNTTILKFAFVV
jgi:hypothetical protein